MRDAIATVIMTLERAGNWALESPNFLIAMLCFAWFIAGALAVGMIIN